MGNWRRKKKRERVNWGGGTVLSHASWIALKKRSVDKQKGVDAMQGKKGERCEGKGKTKKKQTRGRMGRAFLTFPFLA